MFIITFKNYLNKYDKYNLIKYKIFIFIVL